MNTSKTADIIPCPYCGGLEYRHWAEELGFSAVRCSSCAFIYVNPRPSLGEIDAAVRTGAHGADAQNLNVVSRRIAAKVRRYRSLFADIFDDVWRRGSPISWLDVGAGYGEVLEAVTGLAPPGSRIEGLEPMRPKAEQARRRGLTITEDYLRPTHPKVDIISVVDVFSHIPDFGAFLADARSALSTGGELFIETGNLADVERREDFPGELGLPDHLVFTGETQLRGFLRKAGFTIIHIERQRIDDAIYFAKNLVKLCLGRPGHLRLPYTSDYRQLLVRARLDGNAA